MKIPGLAILAPTFMLSSFIDLPSPEHNANQQEDLSSSGSKTLTQNPDAVISLLDQGDRLDGMDLQGQTALMWAVINGETKIAAHLIESGADVNATDWWGRSALTYALTYDHKKIVSLLIENGAELAL
jgi:ankyrin repeat protein